MTNKLLGGIGIPAIFITAFWLFNNIVFAEDYARDKRQMQRERIQWRIQRIDNDLLRMRLMRKELIDQQTKQALQRNLETQRSDMVNRLRELR